MRRMLRLTTLGCALLLAGCGGPAGPTTPQATGVAPGVAARGETITVTGTHFGTSPGTLLVGGMAATVTNWADTAIEAVVPPSAANAWQDVAVSTAGGVSEVPDLFVGVEFLGTGPELQGFLDGLEQGTAVLLQAETYDLTGYTNQFLVDNKDLYGRGPSTTLTLTPTGPTIFLADFGKATTVADLAMVGDDLRFLNGDLSDTVVPANIDLPHITLSGVTFTETTSGVFGSTVGTAAKVDVTVRNSVIDVPNGLIGLKTSGSMVFDNSELQSGVVDVATYHGSLEITGSSVVASDALFGAEAGLSIVDSSVLVTDGGLTLVGAANVMLGGSAINTGGPIEVRESVLESLDGDVADSMDEGYILVRTQFAHIRITDNVMVRAHEGMVVQTTASLVGESDIELIGNLDMRIGVFEAEEPGNGRPADLIVTANAATLRNRISILGNTIATTRNLIVEAAGASGDVFLRDNALSVGDAMSMGVLTAAVNGVGRVELTGNLVTTTAVAQVLATDLGGDALVVSGNQFEKSVAGPGALLIQASGGSCEFTDNTADFDDPTDVNGSGVVLNCMLIDSDQRVDITGNEIGATGGAGSVFAAVFDGSGTVGVSSNVVVSDGRVQLDLDGTTATLSDNALTMAGGPLLVSGSASANLTIMENTIANVDPLGPGLHLVNVGSSTIENNGFTVMGTPAPAAVALSATVVADPVTLTATGNTFKGYSNALAFTDVSGAALGIDAKVNDNVFEMVIDAAPKVAELKNVKDEIDARNNVWGTNTDLPTVQGYVTLSGDTGVQGGSILLDPITQP